MRTKLHALGRLLFSPNGSIGWTAYLVATFAIFFIKFPLDAWFASYSGFALDFISYWRSSLFDGLQFAVGWAVQSPFGFLEAPIIWSGLVLAAKRMRSIGWPNAAVGLFFVPFMNFVVLGLLIAMPDQRSERSSHFPPKHRPFRSFGAAEWGASIRGAVLGFLCTLAMLATTPAIESLRFALLLMCGSLLTGLFATSTYSSKDENGYQGLSWVSAVAATGYCLLAQIGIYDAMGIICSIPVAAIFSLFGSLLGGLLIEWAKPADQRKWGL